MGSTSEASSFSTPTSGRSWSNHVFLSFRGDDTRRGFTGHLFDSLERRGIKTFKDDHDLERGKVISVELMKAIEDSMFALIILSPNYASSTWCLDELQKIVECKKEVFPIFHCVDPSDVRHQRGCFAKAFREHEEKFREDRKKVERWRLALRKVASYSGWDSKDQHEATLIETIVGHIQKKLIPRLPCFTDNLVGIDSRVKEVNSLMGMLLNDVRFIGIWGMGGIGMDIDEVVNILENCGDHPKIGIDILIERSLLTLDRITNKLGMHDLLQDMGRNIVYQESPNEPGKRSRLWSQKDIDYVLTKNKGTDEIQGIVLNLVQPYDYEARWNTEAFNKISQLRLLKLCDMQLLRGLNCLPSALKVVHWRGCPLKTLPLTNQLDEVIDLKLPHSRIEQLWHGTKLLEKLKFINLSFSKNLKQSPDFVGVPNLESLVLEGCTSLTEVHPSLIRHKKLVMLNLKDCRRFKTLPSKMETSSLNGLNLSGCSEFKRLPEFAESMEHLSVLSLEGTAITKLPTSLGCLVGLAHLNMKNCKNLVCLPDTIHKLKSLIVLNVSGCSKLSSLPDGLKEIKCLEELNASETAIQELPSSVFYLENLKDISVAGCKGPVSNSINNFFLPFKRLFGNQQTSIGFRLPPSIRLPSLWKINLSYCNLSEESFPDDFCHLSSLVVLDLTGNNFVSLPSCISKLSNLERLILNFCKKLQRLPELPSNMRGLDASNCTSLEISKFNPSKPCSLFSSPIKCRLPRQLKCLFEELHLPRERFDMLIPGSEIPPWFSPNKTVSFAKISIPQNCPMDEWVGFALCFLIVSYAVPPDVCHHEVECYLFGPNGKEFISSRYLPPMEPCDPHLYILYLSFDELCGIICKGGDCREIEFVLKRYCCYSLEIVRCGSRLVCKQDVEDIYGNSF
ncbi:unnamed protein product [Sphenostylis stenocarpa]|uniref:TIR domain-containing protein n=1 Tax=Sphenostylis stenocarpa TaxID=92480 RepID=A0AA86T459_9FABA|nr:unnamed protein product [Sphenostylis stenocarpa]